MAKIRNFRYYDIHTHKNPEFDSEVLTIYSLYQDFARSQHIKYCSIGMHPRFLYNYMQDFSTLELHALNPNVLAIGECGFDKLSKLDMELQKLIFSHHLELANNLQKPLIVHCVRAYEEIFSFLKETPAKVPVIFHGFNKNEKIAAKIQKRGYYLSFGGAMLQEHLPEYFKDLDHDKVFLETDDMKCDIREIYAIAAKLRNIPEEDIILQIENNFKKVFFQNV